jgi:hypothetical protein
LSSCSARAQALVSAPQIDTMRASCSALSRVLSRLRYWPIPTLSACRAWSRVSDCVTAVPAMASAPTASATTPASIAIDTFAMTLRRASWARTTIVSSAAMPRSTRRATAHRSDVTARTAAASAAADTSSEAHSGSRMPRGVRSAASEASSAADAARALGAPGAPSGATTDTPAYRSVGTPAAISR